MPLIKIHRERCNQDHICVNECPAAVFQVGEDGFPTSDPESEARCISCGHCASVCPKAALEWSGHDPLQLEPIADFGSAPSRVINALRSRRTVRKFSPEPVSLKEISQILDTAGYTPSASNLRPVKLVHLHGRQAMEKVGELTAEGIRDLPVYHTFSKKWYEGTDLITRGASSAIVTYAEESSPWGREDSAIAITYAEIAAHALGLGSCWGGLVVRASRINSELPRYLGLKENETITGALFLGYPEVQFYRLPPRRQPDTRRISEE